MDRRRLTKFLAVCSLAVSAMTGTAATASASYSVDGPYRPAVISDSYRGWAYAIETGTTDGKVSAWRWTPSGWAASSFPLGASVWAHPFGGGWSWAYRNGAWHAIHTASLARWSCAAPTNVITRPAYGMDLYRYNSYHSDVIARLGANQTVRVLCANGFPDANASPVPIPVSWGPGTPDDPAPVTEYVCPWGPTGIDPGPCERVPAPMLLVSAVVDGTTVRGYVNGRTPWCTQQPCAMPPVAPA